MFHLIGFLFFILLFIVIAVVGIVGSLLRELLGPKRTGARQQTWSKCADKNTNAHAQSYETSDPDTSRPKKLFDASDGEYVDFEEVK